MGNSLKKNIELALFGINRFSYMYRSKLSNFKITNDHIVNCLKYFNSIKNDQLEIINETKLENLISRSYEILELKQKIHNYLNENNLDINNVSFEKINKEFNLGKSKEYSLYRAYLYKKYYPTSTISRTFNCDGNDELNFKNILTNKLFIFEKNDSEFQKKYSNTVLCQLLGKNTYKEG